MTEFIPTQPREPNVDSSSQLRQQAPQERQKPVESGAGANINMLDSISLPMMQYFQQPVVGH